MVEDGGILDPRTVDYELKAGLRRDEVRGQVERQAEGGKRGEECDPVGQFGAVGRERDQDRSGQRKQEDQRENRVVDRYHSQCPAIFQMKFNETGQTVDHGTTIKSSTAAAPAASHAA